MRHPTQCQSAAPTTPTVNGVYHRHFCKHEATQPWGTVLVHECRCGLTWRSEPHPSEVALRPDVTAAEVEHLVKVIRGDREPKPYVLPPKEEPWWPHFRPYLILLVVFALVYAAVFGVAWLTGAWR